MTPYQKTTLNQALFSASINKKIIKMLLQEKNLDPYYKILLERDLKLITETIRPFEKLSREIEGEEILKQIK